MEGSLFPDVGLSAWNSHSDRALSRKRSRSRVEILSFWIQRQEKGFSSLHQEPGSILHAGRELMKSS